MINKLINLASYLDQAGFKKEADRVDLLIKNAEVIAPPGGIYTFTNPNTGTQTSTDSPSREQYQWWLAEQQEKEKDEGARRQERLRALEDTPRHKELVEEQRVVEEERDRMNAETQAYYERIGDEERAKWTAERISTQKREVEEAGIRAQEEYRAELAAERAAKEEEGGWNKYLEIAAEVADPTGILSWDDVKPAYSDMQTQINMAGWGAPKTWWQVILFLFALIALIPVVGKLGKLGKVPKWLKLSDVDKALDVVDNTPSILRGTKAYKKVNESKEMIVKSTTLGSDISKASMASRALGTLKVRKMVAMDEKGRIFVAVDLPGGGTKMFYRSTGRGSSNVAKGDWAVMNGIKTNGHQHNYIKDFAKRPVSGFIPIMDELKALYKAGDIVPTQHFKFQNGTRSGLREVERFNTWMKNADVHTMTRSWQPAKRVVPKGGPYPPPVGDADVYEEYWRIHDVMVDGGLSQLPGINTSLAKFDYLDLPEGSLF